jgi:hypothetical protein
MKKHLDVPILFGLTVVALIHILMDVFANNLIFREKKRKTTIFLRKEAKKRNFKRKEEKDVKLDARNYLFTCMSIKIFPQWAIAIISKKLVGNKLWNGGQLPNWPPPGYANEFLLTLTPELFSA